MDDGGHNRENGRDKTDQYKSLHSPWMLSQHQMKDSNTFRLMAIVAERDKVIQERNLALSEKKTALAHRDMAILQRDAANAERDTAIMERDNAMAALEYARENGMNGNNRSGCPPGCTALHVTKHINHNPRQQPPPPQQLQHAQAQQQQTSEATYNTREMHTPEAFSISTVSEGAAKGRKAKRPKEGKVQPSPSKKTPKSPKKSKKGGGEDLNRQAKIPKSQGEWMGEVEGGEDLNKQLSSTKHHEWKLPDLGLNQVTYDESMMPIPVCSCTGKDRQCYKWGNGGWQSACCTMTLSMYPLPVMPNKRHARVGGRKMSGNVFNRLLSRLAAEGHDLSTALDLKDHWAKHGTNRYITVK